MTTSKVEGLGHFHVEHLTQSIPHQEQIQDVDTCACRSTASLLLDYPVIAPQISLVATRVPCHLLGAAWSLILNPCSRLLSLSALIKAVAAQLGRPHPADIILSTEYRDADQTVYYYLTYALLYSLYILPNLFITIRINILPSIAS